MSVHRFGATERIAWEVDVEPDEDALGGAYLALWAGGLRLGATDRIEALGTFLEALARFRNDISIAATSVVPIAMDGMTSARADRLVPRIAR